MDGDWRRHAPVGALDIDGVGVGYDTAWPDATQTQLAGPVLLNTFTLPGPTWRTMAAYKPGRRNWNEAGLGARKVRTLRPEVWLLAAHHGSGHQGSHMTHDVHAASI
jgi:hypothetical protein